MAEPNSSGSEERHDMPSGSRTETIDATPQAAAPILQLRLNPPKNSGPKVKWTTDTVDNEFLGKKKSKCCCIYEKPKVFGESSSSEEDDDGDGCTPHCKGHKKKCYRHKPSDSHNHDHSHDDHDDHSHHQSDGGAQGGQEGPSNGI